MNTKVSIKINSKFQESRVFLVNAAYVLLLSCHFSGISMASSGMASTEVVSAGHVINQSQAKKDSFVGSQQCKNCHREQFKDWSASDHYQSMLKADDNAVVGNFDNVKLKFNGIDTHFFKNEDGYWVTTAVAPEKMKTFKISYTFGHYPLQQYLIETEKGHIQAFNIAWDSRNQQEGGQRWFHLREKEEISFNDPFFWTRHYQNWNNRCADCHSTNVTKHYNLADNSYSTHFFFFFVACEACHGPASQHIDLLKSGKYNPENTGFIVQLPLVAQWKHTEEKDTAEIYYPDLSGNSDSEVMPNSATAAKLIKQIKNNTLNTCGGCHSRRSGLTKTQHGKQYHDQFQLQTLDERLYHVDGQIKDEVFVMGSFMQSKMHDKGVTCGNCHNSHTGKLRAEGNALCFQCHQSASFDTEVHHGHQKNSEGAQCVNCHMPQKTYMGVDARRDHSFSIPAPDLSARSESPDACTSCHQTKDNQWAVKSQQFFHQKRKKKLDQQLIHRKQTQKNYREQWNEINQTSQQMDPLVVRKIESFISQPDSNIIKQATLISNLAAMPSRASAELIAQKLTSENPLIRRSAVTGLQNMPPQVKLKLLLPVLNEENLAVRAEIGRVLASVINRLPDSEQTQLLPVINSYRETLMYSADSPATLASLATLEAYFQNFEQVEFYYKKALEIEPAYIPARVNIADLYRSQGNEKMARQQLLKAVNLAPDSAMAQHSLGLHYIRNRNYKQALKHLHLATITEGQQPRYTYVYAVALESQNQLQKAIKALKTGVERWPNQVDMLFALINFMEKNGNLIEAASYVSQLSKIAPSSPEVKKLISRYQDK